MTKKNVRETLNISNERLNSIIAKLRNDGYDVDSNKSGRGDDAEISSSMFNEIRKMLIGNFRKNK